MRRLCLALVLAALAGCGATTPATTPTSSVPTPTRIPELVRSPTLPLAATPTATPRPPSPTAARAGPFAPAAPMRGGRFWHTATVLHDGRVLVAGGHDGRQARADAELYDPHTDTWTLTGSMRAAQFGHTATLLPDGQVLITRLVTRRDEPPAERYDPATGHFTPTAPVPWGLPLFYSATLLGDGQVLAIEPRRAARYDPASDTWAPTGAKVTGAHGTATRLPDGRVLVIGGVGPNFTLAHIPLMTPEAELYDPATDRWGAAAPLPARRGGHRVALLPDGRALVIGGDDMGRALQTTQVYDPATDTWRPAATTRHPHQTLTATPLPNGRVVIVGTIAAERYDPVADTWTLTGFTLAARGRHTATRLPDGRILIAGGGSSGSTGAPTQATELYDPATD